MRANTLTFDKQIRSLRWGNSSGGAAFHTNTNTNADVAYLLQGCTNIKTLTQLHARILTTGLHQNLHLLTKLLSMYTLYGTLENAHLIFDEIPKPNVNVLSWNAMIRGYARSRLWVEAMSFYREMIMHIIPNKLTFVFVVKACGLEEGKHVHSHILRYGFHSDVFVATALGGMYAKCGAIEIARQVFDRIPQRQRDVISWNAMVAAHGKNGNVDEMLSLVAHMQQAQINPTSATMITLLSAFVGAGSVKQFKLIHSYVIRNGFHTDVSVANALIDMYSKLGCIDAAVEVFDKLSEKEKDVVSWSSMIAGCAQIGQLKEALILFYQMQQTDVKLNRITILNVLSACADLRALQRGKDIHSYIRKHGFQLDDDSIGSALVAMYAKCGRIDLARQVFDILSKRDTLSWNAMIAGYTQNGYVDKPLLLFHQMQLAGVEPDGITMVSILPAYALLKALQQGKWIHWYSITRGLLSLTSVCNALIDMYAKCGYMESADRLFDRMSKRDLVSWNIVIAGHAQNGDLNESLTLFRKLPSVGMIPNPVTLMSILPVCGDLKALQEGKDIHVYIIKNGFDLDTSVMTALVAMYAKCGDVETAGQLFDKMSRKDVVSWNTMISGYVQNGHTSEALTLFHQLQMADVKPDSNTVATVLSAYAHLGALQQGKWIHAYIIRSGLELDVPVGTALIDMYAKCGSVEFSFQLFEKMCNRDVASWNAMIAAYGMNGHGEKALALFSQMQQVGPMPDHITFICVLSACSHSGLMNEGFQYFDCMSQKYCITPRVEHYACMVDLFGRVGLLNEAHKFIINMPLEPSVSVWGALLFACRIHRNIELGEQVAKLLLKLDSKNSGAYLLLSSIYANASRWNDAAKMRTVIKERRLEKSPGCSWIAIKSRVHLFLAGHKLLQRPEEIYAMLENLVW